LLGPTTGGANLELDRGVHDLGPGSRAWQILVSPRRRMPLKSNSEGKHMRVYDVAGNIWQALPGSRRALRRHVPHVLRVADIRVVNFGYHGGGGRVEEANSAPRLVLRPG